MRICFLNPFDLVNLCDDHIRERSFVRDTDEHNDIRPPKAGVGLLDSGEALESRQHVFRPPGFDLDENIGFRCHRVLPNDSYGVPPGISRRRCPNTWCMFCPRCMKTVRAFAMSSINLSKSTGLTLNWLKPGAKR